MIRDVRPPLRVTLTALLVLLAVSAPAWAATPTKPYKIGPTRSCMIEHHAHLAPANRAQLNQIQWVITTVMGSPLAFDMDFSASPSQAAVHQRTLRRTYRVDGMSRTWIRWHLLRRENVVVHPDNVATRFTANQSATILGCLRR
jgi:hypothetical protein